MAEKVLTPCFSSFAVTCHKKGLLLRPADRGLQVVKLKSFSKFENTTDALAAATALTDSKLSKSVPLRAARHTCWVLGVLVHSPGSNII